MNTSPKKASVSVIIPTYNGKHLLKKYIPSVKAALEFSSLQNEIIIIDDASTDDSIKYLEEQHPNIIVLQNAKNQGFTEAINKGIRIASKDLTLCLNNDIELPPNFFENQLDYFVKDDTFGVMSSIKDIKSKKLLEGRKTPEITSYGIKVRDAGDTTTSNKNPYTFFLCGGNGLFDTKKIQLLGGFSSLYKPFYFEDVDLSARAWLAGWKSYYCDKAECYHVHSATIKSLNKQEYIEKTSYLNFLKFSYFFLPENMKRKFILATYARIILFSISATINKQKRIRVTAMTLFLKEKKSISKNSDAFSDLCRKHCLNRLTMRKIISVFFPEK